MSDYRDWCGSCKQEVNFGSHDPDCDWLHSQRIAAKEKQEFEDGLREQYKDKTNEEIITEAIALQEEMNALQSRVLGLGKKWDFIRYELMNRKAIEELRERTGRRYI